MLRVFNRDHNTPLCDTNLLLVTNVIATCIILFNLVFICEITKEKGEISFGERRIERDRKKKEERKSVVLVKLVVFRRYAPGSYVLFLQEFTIYLMVLVNRICSKV